MILEEHEEKLAKAVRHAVRKIGVEVIRQCSFSFSNSRKVDVGKSPINDIQL